jgi:hypothetical protein
MNATAPAYSEATMPSTASTKGLMPARSAAASDTRAGPAWVIPSYRPRGAG